MLMKSSRSDACDSLSTPQEIMKICKLMIQSRKTVDCHNLYSMKPTEVTQYNKNINKICQNSQLAKKKNHVVSYGRDEKFQRCRNHKIRGALLCFENKKQMFVYKPIFVLKVVHKLRNAFFYSFLTTHPPMVTLWPSFD